MLVFVLQWLCLDWEILIMFLSQFPLTFQYIQNRMPCITAYFMTILVLIGDGLHDHLRDVPWDNVFKLSASTAASEFCEWVQVEIDAHISYHKYQVKPPPPPWFSAACAAAIAHRDHFFHLHQQNKSESKVKFRQASNHCKRLLEAAKLAYATKTKESITNQKLGSCDF